jgi:uncharacterized tellurite resistance protein B-like protein
MDWRDFSKRLILADGRVGAAEAKLLRQLMLTDGKVDADEASFLMELKRAARDVHPEFTKFLHDVLRSAIVKDGRVDRDETAWLRKMILEDKMADSSEMDLLMQIRQEARQVCPEFLQLLKDCEKAGLVTLTPAGH